MGKARSPSSSGTNSNSDSSSSSSSGSSSSSKSSETSSPPKARHRPVTSPSRKRPRSPSPTAARHAERQSDKDRPSQRPSHDANRRHESEKRGHKRSASPARRRQHSNVRTRDADRRDDHGDRRDRRKTSGERQSSKADDHSGRREDRRREPSSRSQPDKGRRQLDRSDRQRSKADEEEPVRPDRRQSHRDADADRHRRQERDDKQDDRKPVRSDNHAAAKDHTGARDQGLPPPPPQPEPGQAEGQGPGGPANGSSRRQNRWAKEEDRGPEQWGKPGNQPDGKQGKEEKSEPEANFALSGKLAAESNTVKGVVLVHQEPPEARKPSQMWRLYGFKNGEPIDKPLYIHRQTCYLFGRERRVADVPLDHPSISKQHAILQYRLTEKEGADGMMVSAVRPYLMDLGSANGTYLNNDRVEAERYYELLERDMIKFGHSSREYVLLHAQSNAAAG